MMDTKNFITKAAYLDLVRAKAVPHNDLVDRLGQLARILGTTDEEDRLKEINEAFLVDISNGCVGICQVMPLAHVRSLLTSNFSIGNWHYDRNAECLLINLRRGRHEHLSGLLHRIYVNTDDMIESAAEKFIDEGLGWFKSSSSFGRMLVSDRVRLTAQERAAFASVGAYEQG